jgi:WD40 repeat protein/serine/threonine protein kinase
MNGPLALDEELIRRLPLPLAQLYRRAHNAKSPLDRHLNAFFLWEASLKLLASTAIVAYADLGQPEPELTECLTQLARPSLGHWWEFVRRLLPVLAERGRAEFVPLRDLVLGRARDDLPRAAGLDAALREALEGKTGARAQVYLAELFDRLVRYRNKEIGHGALGQRPTAFYERMGASLLLAAAEVLNRLPVLAGAKLLYIAEVRLVEGNWLVQRYELTGEAARRLQSAEVPRSGTAGLSDAERVYLSFTPVSVEAPVASTVGELRALHPLVIYDLEVNEAAILNSRAGKRKTEYLCYTSGKTVQRPDLGGQQRGLLAQVLGMEVSEAQVQQWAVRSQAEEPPAETPPARRSLGEFELLSELGRGGMGVVYRAWQPSLGRQVAVKALLQTGDPRAEDRFQREIRALGRVEHPNLVKVFTSGSDGDQWFYAMELLEGAPLSAVCDELQTRSASATEVDVPLWQQALGQAVDQTRKQEKQLGDAPARPAGPPAAERPGPALPAGRNYVRHVAELVQQAAEAAHALHEHGIIHRDIKPGNILLSADGSQAVLMDLGLAQLADDVQGRLTRTRQFVGTLRYASPEQVLAAGQVDRRSDVYSLGATLWELLSLRPLFGATERTPTPELMKQITTEEPEQLRKYHPGIARDLEAIVHKCLEKKEADRYATARELAEDLRRFQSGEPVAARPVSGWQRALRWMVRHPTETAAAGLLLLALVLLAGGGGAVWLWRDAEAARGRAETAEGLATDALAKEDDALRGEQQARQQAQQALEGETQARREKEDLLVRVKYLGTIRLAAQRWQEGDLYFTRHFLAECPAEHRGWEWDYLQRCCRLEALTLKGHARTIYGVAWSPDGTRLAGAADDKTVTVWNARTGQEALTLNGHNEWVLGVAFSPDGTRLASASHDGTVIVHDARTGQEALVLKGHLGAVFSLAFSPDSSRLTCASDDESMTVWDTHTGRRSLMLMGHTGGVHGVAWSPDGTRLASASLDKTVKVWDAGTGQVLVTLMGHTGGVYGVAWSPDSTRLASGSEDRTVKIWDARMGQDTFTLKGHTETVWSVAWSPDGTRLASAGGNLRSLGEAKVWDARTGQELLRLNGHRSTVLGVAWSPDEGRLASASADGTVRVWDVRMAPESLFFRGHKGLVHAVAFSPDGTRLASAAAGYDEEKKERYGESRVWDVRTGQEMLTLKGHADFVNDVAWSPDGTRLASASHDRTVRIWDARTGQETLSLKEDTTSWVLAVAWSPDGTRLASAASRTVKVWDALSGRQALTLQGHTGVVYGVRFSPDGARLASASEDRTIKIWDARTGQETLTLRGHNGEVMAVAWSADDKRLTSASYDRTAKVWDTRTGQETLTLRGHTDGINAVAPSPDGTRLASASQDQTVKIWDARTGQETLTLKGHRSAVLGLDWSPDGTRLAASSQDGTVRVWELDPERYWNLREAAAAEHAQQWFAAAFHLSRLVEAEARFAALEAGSGATGSTPLNAAVTLHGLRSLDVGSDLADLLRRREAAHAKLTDGHAKPGQ